MRKFYALFTLIALFVVSGCSMTPQVKYNNQKLNGNVEHTTSFHNDSPQHVLVTCKVSDFPSLRPIYHVIPPGNYRRFSDTSDWRCEFSMVYWDPASNSPIGEEMKELKFVYNSFFHREVHITEFMLSGVSVQKGYVTNKLPISIELMWQGNLAIFAPGETKLLNAVSYGMGRPIHFSWIPTRKNKHHTPKSQELRINHDPSDHYVFINDEPISVGWFMEIIVSHRSWHY